MRIPALCLVLLLSSAAAFAQRGAQADTVAPLAPGDVQKLLEGYAIVQAQEFLGMTDAEFGPFLPKLRALQDMRRRNEQERVRLLMELRRMTNGRAGQMAESAIRDHLRALRDLETKSLNDLQRAYDSIDQSLDVRQQARFRIFEQEIEQRKLQLLMRARQQNRANRPPADQ
jgi:hypothetical protein